MMTFCRIDQRLLPLATRTHLPVFPFAVRHFPAEPMRTSGAVARDRPVSVGQKHTFSVFRIVIR
ncbi:hypothetical protein DWW79_09435 [Alistipes sp. AF17-16]|nr:hypothetical protein DW082_00315 [Alistipes sp. AF48-12]RHR62524.1 hypothetical protein DWW79_09435 [Alistipes sp. AF17-16]